MSFTTSFFAVSDKEMDREMEVDDDARSRVATEMKREGAADDAVEGKDILLQAIVHDSESKQPSHLQQEHGLDLASLPPHNGESEGPDMARKKAPTKKKKGTAAPVPKAPKRGSKGTTGKKGTSKSSSTKKKAPTAETGSSIRGSSTIPEDDDDERHPGGSSEMDDSGAGGADEESDSGPYCICRGPDNHRFMIACDRCEDWFHGDCIGMDKYTGENLVQRYICPNCTDGRLYVTRYKKTCALDGCAKPARMYGDFVGKDNASIFCCDDHCQGWWEQLVATLPRRGSGLLGDVLTQEEFMGLLGNPTRRKGEATGWKLGEEPFAIKPDFWDTVPSDRVLTQEESTLLSTSVADRHGLGEEIVLCKKMLQLINMAVKQRETLISASSASGAPKSQLIAKDFCGYDYRLDTIGATAAFAAFVRSSEGEAIFKTGRLPTPDYKPGEGGERKLSAVMCTKRKCKPHAGWSGVHTKGVKHQIKELAAQAKELLDAESRIRDCAAVRYLRLQKENNCVIVVTDGDDEMEDGWQP